MTTKTLVKHLKRLENMIVGIRIDMLRVLNMPNQAGVTNLNQILEETAGSLKGKLPKNPMAWQKKIRKGWGKRLTALSVNK